MHGNTPMERERSAIAALNEQEDFLRSQRYLTDQELLSQLHETLRTEKATLARWAASDDCYVLSAAGKVHLPGCPSMRQFVDRDAAWAPYLDNLERVRDWHGSDNAPPMPTLLTRAQVEALPKYKTCPQCAPTLDHTDKRRGTSGWTTLKAGNLKTRHFGTDFSLSNGTEIGSLTRIDKVETADGLDFRAHFDGLDSPLIDPSTEVMYRTGTRALG